MVHRDAFVVNYAHGLQSAPNPSTELKKLDRAGDVIAKLPDLTDLCPDSKEPNITDRNVI